MTDLVLSQCGSPGSEADRARVERLCRWWKVKTKASRPVSEDEPKALRMIVKAFMRGDDFDEDPERLLFKEVLA